MSRSKKAPSSREQANKRDAIRVEVPLNGLYMEKYVAFPVWDSSDIDKEQWQPTDYNANDPSTLYVDSESSQLGSVLFEGLENANIDWKRPNVLFSPFKPVVWRQTSSCSTNTNNTNNNSSGNNNTNNNNDNSGIMTTNPYDNIDESEEGKAQRDAAISSYRELRPLRAVGDEDEATARAAAAKSRVAAATAALTAASGGGGTPASRRRGAAPTPVPFLMGAFQSALMILSQNQHHIQPGCFAWELIYPQAPNTVGMPIPVINSAGKYCVRLFVGGAFRKITIDDRLPADSSGRSIFTVTDYKEIWPALIVKAIMKVLTPALEAQIALNPVVTLSTLMCGWTPQILNPSRDELLVYRMLQRVRTGTENLVMVASCSDSALPNTAGAIGNQTSGALQQLAIESAQSNSTSLGGAGGTSTPSGGVGGNNPSTPSSNILLDRPPPPLTNLPATVPPGAVGGIYASAGMSPASSTNFSGSISGNPNQDGGKNPAASSTLTGANAAVAAALALREKERDYRNNGLRAFHAYHIVDMRTYGHGFLLRLVCPGSNYQGPYAYDKEDWTSDLIETIGFNPSEHRNPHELAKRWNDFWVPWESFKDFFQSFIVLRYAGDKKAFPYFKNFPADVMLPTGQSDFSGGASQNIGGQQNVSTTSPTSTNAAAASAIKRPGGGGRTQQNAASSSQQQQQQVEITAPTDVIIPKHQKSAVRWVHLVNTDPENESSALIVMTGTPAPNSVISAAVAPPESKTTKTGSRAAQAAAAQAAASHPTAVVAPPSAADTENEPQQWQVNVHRFDWSQSQPFCLLDSKSCARGLNQSFFVVLAPGKGTTLRITAENCPIGCAVAVTSPCEITSGNEREVYLEGSGIVNGSDAGTFGEHSAPSNIASAAKEQIPAQTPGQFSHPGALQSATTWFKRHITVKAETTASFVLSLLPKNVDVASHRLVPEALVSGNVKGGKGGGKTSGSGSGQQQQAPNSADGASRGGRNAPGGKNVSAASNADTNMEQNNMEQEPDPVRPISDFANLVLVDVDTGHTTVDTIGKILNVPISPNRHGYIIMAVSRTPEPYRKGNWKLSYYSTRIFDTFETKNFDDVAVRNGQYVQNDLRQVFRYNFFFLANNEKAEPTGPSALVQACLRDDSGMPVPFTIELRHSSTDPAIASAVAAQTAAATGGSSSSSRGSPSLKKSMNNNFSASAANANANNNDGDNNANGESSTQQYDVVATRTANHYAIFEHIPLLAHEKNTPNYYSLVCSLDPEYAAAWEQRRKSQVIEGYDTTTKNQERILFSQQFQRRMALNRNPQSAALNELEQPPPMEEPQPGNIVFSVSLHFSNPKFELKEDSSIADALSAVKQSWGRKEFEEKMTLAASTQGKRSSNKKVNPKDEQIILDAINAHFERAKGSRGKFLTNRKGIFLPYLTDEGKPVLDALSEPSLKHVPIATPVEYSQYESDPQRAADAEKQEALSKSLAYAQPTTFSKKLVEKTVELTAGLRAGRKAWIEHVNDQLTAHWAEVAPNKPIGGANQAQEEQDDKKRRVPGRGRR